MDTCVFEKVSASAWSELTSRGPARGADVDRLVLGGDLSAAGAPNSACDAADASRRCVERDLYLHAIRFSQRRGHQPDAGTALVGILSRLLALARDPRTLPEDAFSAFGDLVVAHSVQRPPRCALVFAPGEARAVVEYVTNTMFRHWRMYACAFAPRAELSVVSVEPRAEAGLFRTAPLRDFAERSVDWPAEADGASEDGAFVDAAGDGAAGDAGAANATARDLLVRLDDGAGSGGAGEAGAEGGAVDGEGGGDDDAESSGDEVELTEADRELIASLPGEALQRQIEGIVTSQIREAKRTIKGKMKRQMDTVEGKLEIVKAEREAQQQAAAKGKKGARK